MVSFVQSEMIPWLNPWLLNGLIAFTHSRSVKMPIFVALTQNSLNIFEFYQTIFNRIHTFVVGGTISQHSITNQNSLNASVLCKICAECFITILTNVEQTIVKLALINDDIWCKRVTADSRERARALFEFEFPLCGTQTHKEFAPDFDFSGPFHSVI